MPLVGATAPAAVCADGAHPRGSSCTTPKGPLKPGQSAVNACPDTVANWNRYDTSQGASVLAFDVTSQQLHIMSQVATSTIWPRMADCPHPFGVMALPVACVS